MRIRKPDHQIIRTLKRKLRRVLLATLLLLSLTIVYFMAFQRSYVEDKFVSIVTEYSRKFNFIVHEVSIEDYDKTYCVDLQNNRNFNQYIGSPVMLVPIQNIKQDLENIDCISHANVMRYLPTTLRIKITTKKPIAIWQNSKKFSLITTTGDLIAIRNNLGLERFIIVTGDDAPKHTADLLHIIEIEPEIYQKLVSATRVGGRRWNLKFDTGTEILLPEYNPELAWQKFLNFYRTNPEFQQWKYKTIDLRVENKVYAKKQD